MLDIEDLRMFEVHPRFREIIKTPQLLDVGYCGFKDIATLGLHLGFSAKLKILQVPACKMEPRSGYIMQLEPPIHPATGSVENQK